MSLSESPVFFLLDEPHPVAGAVSDGLAASGYVMRRGRWDDARASLREGSAAAYVVNWTLGEATVSAFVREANSVPIAALLLRDDNATLAAVLQSGCAAAWVVPLDSKFTESAAVIGDRGLAVVRLVELVRDLGDLSEEYLKRLVAVEHELFDLRAGGNADDNSVPEAKRVLVVDDEPVIVALLSEALKYAGYEVEGAGSAEEAVTLFRAKPAAIVLTDKNLPGKSGIDLLRALREESPNTAVLLMTGYASLSSAVEAMNLGAVGYLTKPFGNIDDVVRQIAGVSEGVSRKMKAGRIFRAFMERNQALIDRMRALNVGRGSVA